MQQIHQQALCHRFSKQSLQTLFRQSWPCCFSCYPQMYSLSRKIHRQNLLRYVRSCLQIVRTNTAGVLMLWVSVVIVVSSRDAVVVSSVGVCSAGVRRCPKHHRRDNGKENNQKKPFLHITPSRKAHYPSFVSCFSYIRSLIILNINEHSFGYRVSTKQFSKILPHFLKVHKRFKIFIGVLKTLGGIRRNKEVPYLASKYIQRRNPKLSYYFENLCYSEYPKSPRQSEKSYSTITLSEHLFLHRRSSVPESEEVDHDYC